MEDAALPLAALVGQLNADAGVEERQLAQPLLQRVKGVGRHVLEDLRVWAEADGRAVRLALADDLQVVEGHAALVLLAVEVAILGDRHLQPGGQGVDHAHAHAVQAAGDLVSPAAELAARVQHRKADLYRGPAELGVDARGDAAAVVGHADGVVLLDGDLDGVADARHGLVDGVVHDLIDQVVEPALIGGADVHARAAAHRLQPLQNLDIGCIIVIDLLCHALTSSLPDRPPRACAASGRKWGIKKTRTARQRR